MEQIDAAVSSSPVANNEPALTPLIAKEAQMEERDTTELKASSTTARESSTPVPVPVPVLVAKETEMEEGTGTELTNVKASTTTAAASKKLISSDDDVNLAEEIEGLVERGIEYCDDPYFECAKSEDYGCNKKRGVCCYVWNDRWNMTGLLLLLVSLVVLILPNTPLRKGDQYQPPSPQMDNVCAAYRFSNMSNSAAGDDDYYRGLPYMPYINNTYSLCSACLRVGCFYCYRANVPYCWGVDEGSINTVSYIKGNCSKSDARFYTDNDDISTICSGGTLDSSATRTFMIVVVIVMPCLLLIALIVESFIVRQQHLMALKKKNNLTEEEQPEDFDDHKLSEIQAHYTRKSKYGMPSSNGTKRSNYWIFLCNNDRYLAIFLADVNNPLNRLKRVVITFSTLTWTIFVTGVLNLYNPFRWSHAITTFIIVATISPVNYMLNRVAFISTFFGNDNKITCCNGYKCHSMREGCEAFSGFFLIIFGFAFSCTSLLMIIYSTSDHKPSLYESPGFWMSFFLSNLYDWMLEHLIMHASYNCATFNGFLFIPRFHIGLEQPFPPEWFPFQKIPVLRQLVSIFNPNLVLNTYDEDKREWEKRFAKFPDFFEINQIKKEHTDHLELLLQQDAAENGAEIKKDACGNKSCC